MIEMLTFLNHLSALLARKTQQHKKSTPSLPSPPAIDARRKAEEEFLQLSTSFGALLKLSLRFSLLLRLEQLIEKNLNKTFFIKCFCSFCLSFLSYSIKLPHTI